LTARDPDLPVPSLLGPPLPPRPAGTEVIKLFTAVIY
jgi:hypothetical protein